MKSNIIYVEKTSDTLNYCLSKLPFHIKEELLKFIEQNSCYSINELRMHKNSFISLIVDLKNIKTNIFLDENDIQKIFNNLCDNSLYAHINTIKQGYISMDYGIRAGICGKASLENNEISGIYNISSINIRIPNNINNASLFLFDFLKKHNFNVSVLIYSSPGVGKTTILKDLIYKLINETDKRFAVIDTREELTSYIKIQNNADFFLGYPKGLGIQLATKSMTPQMIICDEIASKKESEEIVYSSNVGVKLIASTHANDFDELLSKATLENVFKNKIFDYALGVKRSEGNKKYNFTLSKLWK